MSDGAFWYAYDPEGNRTARFVDADANGILSTEDTDITEYRWDARNRLVRVTEFADFASISGSSPEQVVDFLYDLENRWIGKRIDLDGDGVFDSRESYVYNGNQMVLQFEGDGDLSHRYLWHPDAVDQLMADEEVTHGVELADFEPTPQVYGPLPEPEPASLFEPVHLPKSTPGEVVLPLTDHLGTVRDLAVYDAATDETTVVNHITYDAYGQKLSETNAAVDHLFAFTGRPLDSVTGLQNNLNRWYDATNGRWMSKDPVGFEGRDANTYRYVGNIATTLTDPNGLDRWLVVAYPSPHVYIVVEQWATDGNGNYYVAGYSRLD